MKKLNAELQTRIEQRLKTFHLKAAEYRENYHEQMWKDSYNQFRDFMPPRPKWKDTWRSNLKLPLANMLMQGSVNLLQLEIWKRNVLFEMVPVEEGIDNEIAELNRALQEWQIVNECNGHRLTEEWWWDGCIFGTPIGKVGWRRERISMPKKQAVEMDDEIMGYEAEDAEFRINQPLVERVPIFDFYIDPGAVDMQSARWIEHVSKVSRAELLRRKKKDGWFGLKDIDSMSSPTTGMHADIFVPKNTDEGEWDRSPSKDDSVKMYHEFRLHEYWYREEDPKCLKYLGMDGPCEIVATMLNNERLIRYELNPYQFEYNPTQIRKVRPFISMPYIMVPGEFYGVSGMETIYATCRAFNAVVNAQLDAGQIAMNPYMTVDENLLPEGYDWRDEEDYPGKKLPTAGGQAWNQLKPPDVTHVGYGLIEMLMHMPQQQTSYTEMMRGARTKHETATGMIAMVEQASRRFAVDMTRMSYEMIADLGEMMYYRNNQFLDEEKRFKIAGKTYEISPDQVRGFYDFKPRLSALAQTGQTNAMELNMLLQGWVQANIVDPRKAFVKIMERAGEKNAQELMTPGIERESIKVKNEHKMLEHNGIMPPPDPYDNHGFHIPEHAKYGEVKAEGLTPEAMEVLQTHIRLHHKMNKGAPIMGGARPDGQGQGLGGIPQPPSAAVAEGAGAEGNVPVRGMGGVNQIPPEASGLIGE